MNRNSFKCMVFAVIFTGCSSGKRINDKALFDTTFDKFKVTSEKSILLKEHYYNFNETTSVGANLDVMGIHRIVSPPYFTFPFEAIAEVNGKPIPIDRYDWYPNRSEFFGKIEKDVEVKLVVIPLKNKHGAVLQMTIINNSTQKKDIKLNWKLSGKPGKSAAWGWSPSNALKTTEKKATIENFEKGILMNLDGVSLAASTGEDSQKSFPLEVERAIPKGKSANIGLTLVLDDQKDIKLEEVFSMAQASTTSIALNNKHWKDALEQLGANAPTLKGASKELENFYNKGLMSMLSTKWNVPEFVLKPYLATSGLDGGALNVYLWDISYPSILVSMLEPAVIRATVLQFIKTDLRDSHSFNPADGKGAGVLYSYNYYNLARLTRDYIAVSKDVALLNEEVNGKKVIDYLYDFCLSPENLDKDPDLIDYGTNKNLLELHLTENYTHYTASPNGERILIYKLLTEMSSWLGKSNNSLIERGEKLKTVFAEKLWDEDHKWLYSLDENRKPRTAYSIQVFDVLRSGILTKNQENGILTHLKEGEFLSKYGIYSLSVTDSGYDKNDVDWGGPGVYAGDAPELIIDLLNSDHSDEGIDLLNRILWWGELPYYPQAIRANTKGYRENGRPNVIAGLTASQVVLTGLFGVETALNEIKIKPINHKYIKGLSLKNIRIHNHIFDIVIDEAAKKFKVIQEGKTIEKNLGEEVILTN